MEKPDRWIVLKIVSQKETIYKVFASWYGGYLGEDKWKMNSGIKRVEETKYSYIFEGYSGSKYECFKQEYGTNMFSRSILNEITNKAKKGKIKITVLTEDTDFTKLTE